MPTRTWLAVLVVGYASLAASAQAQSAAPDRTQDAGVADAKPTWSFRASAATYVLRDDENYVQPTFAADRGGLHLEARYNYEDRRSVSGFVGWNFEFGETVTLQLTPMFGVVFGDTDGVIPGLELDLAWRRLEFYSEGEYVFDVDRRRNRYLYNWSEATVWITDWLRSGLATQRTRAYRSEREIQRGPFVGGTVSKLEWAAYFFNPGADDSLFVMSIGVNF